MRVTPSTMHLTVASDLQRTLGKVQDMQARLASGRRINQLSDSPADAAAALRLRAQEADWNSFARAADDASGWLGIQDNALQSTSSTIRRIRELAISAQNGSLGSAERDGIANEIDQLKEQLRIQANTDYLGRPVFGGFGSTTVSPTGAWAGHPALLTDPMDEVKRQVAPDVTVTVNLDGRKIYGFDGSGNDLFSVVDRISADVRSGAIATTFQANVDQLDARAAAVNEGLATIGARVNLVEAAKDNGSEQIQTLKSNRSNLEDADLAATVMDMQLAQAAYQATLGATARLVMPSLADFLK